MFVNAAFSFLFFYLPFSLFVDCLSTNQTLTEQLPKNNCLTRERSQTPLEKYVFDDSDLDYVNYEVLSISNTSTYTTYKLNATTLKWFDEKLSNRFLWWHELYITVPKNLKENENGFFYIDGGRNDVPFIKPYFLDYISNLSTQCNCITAVIKQIPNQPIKFMLDPTQRQRTEDAIIAMTYYLFADARNYFSNNSYKYLPLLMPMTKAAKRGMDIVQDFLQTNDIPTPKKFVVSGQSKRGWTTFLIAAVDTRVVAAVPIVFDIIRFNAVFHDMFRNLNGAYSYALGDYYAVNATKSLDSLKFYEFSKHVDPFFFFERYRNKKFLIVLASCDEFMFLDNTRKFLRDLSIQTKSNTFLRRLPNTDHSLIGQGPKIFGDIKNFLLLLRYKYQVFPKVTWKFLNNATHGTVEVTASNLEAFDYYQISGNYALSADKSKRDFRCSKLNPNDQIVGQNIQWNSEKSGFKNIPIATSKIRYVYSIDRTAFPNNYVAFFMNVYLKPKWYNNNFSTNEYDQLFTVSTETNIIPEYYPTGDCFGKECYGKII